jgi:hypothetical protein
VLAVGLVAVVAMAAVVFLVVTARHQAGNTAAGASTPPASPSASPSSSSTLGPYGHIASRAADPTPVTVSELFPLHFSAGGAQYTRMISEHGPKCKPAITGSGLKGAVFDAVCNQQLRASYLSVAARLMGTIGVFNLKNAPAAARAGRAAGVANYVAQLRSTKGATQKIGKGTGIEEAETKGHYLILIWAEFTDRKKPKNPAQRQRLANFMGELFQQTANVGLSNRMVDGTP